MWYWVMPKVVLYYNEKGNSYIGTMLYIVVRVGFANSFWFDVQGRELEQAKKV